jgi:hypothetical protein
MVQQATGHWGIVKNTRHPWPGTIDTWSKKKKTLSVSPLQRCDCGLFNRDAVLFGVSPLNIEPSNLCIR